MIVLYRRSQAREALGHFQEAVQDLKQSMELSKSDIYRSGTKEKNDIENSLSRITMKLEHPHNIQSGGDVQDKFQGDSCVDSPIQNHSGKNYQSSKKNNNLKGVGVEEDKSPSVNDETRNTEKIVMAKETVQIRTNVRQEIVNDLSHSMKSATLPSPIEQREKIYILLKQSPQSVGEAFFLINFQWWEQWCAYVNFFFDIEYFTLGVERENKTKRDKTANRKKLEMKRTEIISLLPTGAVIPTKDTTQEFLVEEDDSYSSVTLDSNLGNFDFWGAKPGIINNSPLIEEGDILWSNDLTSRHELIREGGDIRIRSNLVRGYHFEIIPRLVL